MTVTSKIATMTYDGLGRKTAPARQGANADDPASAKCVACSAGRWPAPPARLSRRPAPSVPAPSRRKTTKKVPDPFPSLSLPKKVPDPFPSLRFVEELRARSDPEADLDLDRGCYVDGCVKYGERRVCVVEHLCSPAGLRHGVPVQNLRVHLVKNFQPGNVKEVLRVSGCSFHAHLSADRSRPDNLANPLAVPLSLHLPELVREQEIPNVINASFGAERVMTSSPYPTRRSTCGFALPTAAIEKAASDSAMPLQSIRKAAIRSGLITKANPQPLGL